MKICEKLEFLNNETQSFPYLLDMVATVKVARTRNDAKPNFGSARLLTLCLFVILLRFMTFRPELKEYILNNEIVSYTYYNKI